MELLNENFSLFMTVKSCSIRMFADFSSGLFG